MDGCGWWWFEVELSAKVVAGEGGDEPGSGQEFKTAESSEQQQSREEPKKTWMRGRKK